jgi:hypothetical protein
MRILFIMACLLASACSSESSAPLVATDLEISAPLPGKSMTAGYLALSNNTGDAIAAYSQSAYFCQVDGAIQTWWQAPDAHAPQAAKRSHFAQFL